jgi:rhodanese-related sulfurtransferase
MRSIQVAFIFIVGIFLLSACQAQGVKPTKLDPNNFESKLNSTKEKILVDVRTSDEFEEGHLENAVLIDFLGDDFKTKVAKLDKAKPVFVYCGTGRRSGNASKIFIELGFTQVFDLDGGINAWADAGKKLLK